MRERERAVIQNVYDFIMYEIMYVVPTVYKL